ncbi:nuclear transport factor 2 family protein [Sphingobium sp. BYY-5]|uniref:nuclear transport factor 2 family protein n=1 Tax=Sphingobium sp. BYY-5 TaxID=2926400 RepID=UPI001FA6D74E|nr:nuclear transport factor 2 family protein [Sphingobium sp. BYY-5]MCI4592346.1 nuclear transport factor 2 family protein [Sphingobium sp. BYY-5]
MSALAEQALAIANLKARYCAAADRVAQDSAEARNLFADIFTADFIGDYGMGLLEGGQAITDFLCTAIAGNSLWVLHMLHSPQIEIDGDQAAGDWTVLVKLKRRENGVIDTVLGRYSDQFRLTPQGWRIARVRFDRLE